MSTVLYWFQCFGILAAHIPKMLLMIIKYPLDIFNNYLSVISDFLFRQGYSFT